MINQLIGLTTTKQHKISHYYKIANDLGVHQCEISNSKTHSKDKFISQETIIRVVSYVLLKRIKLQTYILKATTIHVIREKRKIAYRCKELTLDVIYIIQHISPNVHTLLLTPQHHVQH